MSNKALNHPQRGISLQAAENVRDLGGYPSRYGGSTQWSRFVRSGDLNALTAADQQRLLDLGLATVIDLRMGGELKASPNVFADSSNVRYINHDFWGDRFDDYRSQNKTASPAQKLADLYCSGLQKNGFVLAEIMSTFADETQGAYLFHCRSGKDRTGLVAAILLAIAGVEEELICADFALTSTYLKTAAVNPIDAKAPGAWQRGCEPATMKLTLDFIQASFGDAEGYLRTVGVSADAISKIRTKLLE